MQDALLQREKWAIISVLLILSGAAWAFTVYQARMPAGMDMPTAGGQDATPMAGTGEMHGGMPMTADPTSQGIEAALFLLMWVAMMVAMMFPSVYPMVLLFARVSKGQAAQSGAAHVPTWIFVAGYLAIWTFFGGIAYPSLLGWRWLAAHVAWLGDHLPIIAALILIGAGIYQFSGWKGVCLVHCRSPLSFILHKWRAGVSGAFRMGLDHGAYCVGCCWGLMSVLFAMGLMNLAWMGLLTAVIFAEKVTPYGSIFSRVIGGLLIVLGAAMLLSPRLGPWLTG